ncbi:MAG: right-handed parallel beta-helix repeat-containing protein, partial [Planctomycetota bacterium]
MRTRWMTALLCCVATLCAHGVAAGQTTYYVRATGDNGNAGTSPAQAWGTVEHAVRQLQAGDTLWIGAGTYEGRVKPENTGTAEDPITIRGDVTGAQTGDAGSVILERSKHGLVNVQGVSHVRFADLVLRGNTGNVLSMRDAQHVRFQRCEFIGGTTDVIAVPRTWVEVTLIDCVVHGGAQDLIQVNQGGTLTMIGGTLRNSGADAVKLDGGHVTLTGVTMHDIAGAGVNSPLNKQTRATLDRVVIRDAQYGIKFNRGEAILDGCVIHDTSSRGVELGSLGPSVTIRNSTIVRTGSDGIYLGKGGANITNTIVAHTNGYGIEKHKQNWATITQSNNLYWDNSLGPAGPIIGTPGGNVVLGDPHFAGTDDFSLQVASPAIDAGADRDGVVIDMVGIARPVGDGVDIGAYEYATALPPMVTLPYR